jgi:cytidylate kinase
MSALPLLLIDGRAGSGKTTLAAHLAQRTGAQLVHMDDLTPGWNGLAQSSIALQQLLTTGEAKRYDWHVGALIGTISVNLAAPLIVEGCGSITRDTIHFAQQSVWMECPIEIRQQRAIDRDGEMFSEFWEHWAAQELDHLSKHQPNLLAAMVCDGEQDKLQECSQLLSSFPEAEATSGQF